MCVHVSPLLLQCSTTGVYWNSSQFSVKILYSWARSNWRNVSRVIIVLTPKIAEQSIPCDCRGLNLSTHVVIPFRHSINRKYPICYFPPLSGLDHMQGVVTCKSCSLQRVIGKLFHSTSHTRIERHKWEGVWAKYKEMGFDLWNGNPNYTLLPLPGTGEREGREYTKPFQQLSSRPFSLDIWKMKNSCWISNPILFWKHISNSI